MYVVARATAGECEVYITSNATPVTARRIVDPNANNLNQEVIDVALPDIDTDYVVKTFASGDRFNARFDAQPTTANMSLSFWAIDGNILVYGGSLLLYSPPTTQNLTFSITGGVLRVRRTGNTVSGTLRVVLTKFLNI